MPLRALMDPHLDSDTLAAYVDGLLAADELNAANRHIDRCASCRSELSALVAVDAEPGRLAPTDREVACELGAPRAALDGTLGRYRLAHEPGGAAPDSWLRAYDPELSRSVAIERLPASDEDALREQARALAQVRHPNLVAIYDLIVDEDAAYLVTELVEGTTLRDYCRGRSQREIVEVCIRAGRGLAAAHDAGVVHRAFRPETVIVAGDGEVRVIGFGLGRREPAPLQRDQSSFCIAVHELLTGVRPGTGRAPGSVTLSASLPRWIARVLRRGLARDPAARFGSMHALLAALAGDPRAHGRRRLLLAVLAAVALVAAALAIVIVS